MIYEIVDLETGRRALDSDAEAPLTLQKLKKNLCYLNRGALITSDRIKYAIACNLPSTIFVEAGKCIAPTKVKDLSEKERQRFWMWYREEKRGDIVPANVLTEDKPNFVQFAQSFPEIIENPYCTFNEFLSCIDGEPNPNPVKEHAILFKPALVRAIANTNPDLTPIDPNQPIKWQTRRLGEKNYKVGDCLWVKEKAKVLEYIEDSRRIQLLYESDGAQVWLNYPARLTWIPVPGQCFPRGSLFREAARLVLEVIAVRQEQLQEITPEAIRAEGVAVYEGDVIVEPVTFRDRAIYLDQWIRLWNSINKSPESNWEGNPLVTVVEFRRVVK